LNGFLNVLKPPGMTSHDVVDLLRKLLPGVKVGHGGTLDPGAAGVLPLLLGKTTKLASYLLEFPKTYRAELYLGVTTDTADASGKIIERMLPPSLVREEIEAFFSAFTGEHEQVPPMFSAIKIKGRKLYEYAREGLQIERPARTVKIYEIKVINYFPPQRVLFEVKCSSGTYVRSLCEKIGNTIGCGAHMSFLLRTASGCFQIAASQTLEDLIELFRNGREADCLLPDDFPFREHTIILNEMQFKQFRYERCLTLSQLLSAAEKDEQLCPVDGRLLGVYTTKGEISALARWEIIDHNGFFLKPEKIWQ